MSTYQRIVLVLVAVVAAAGGVWLSSGIFGGASTTARGDIPGLLWPNPKVLQPFELQASDGRAFDLARLSERWTLFSFGFTNCPDVCPTTLLTLRKVLHTLRERDAASDVQVVFVSVDPARDSPQRLAEYVTFFDPEFLGATADLDRLEDLTGQLGVFHERGKPDANGDYDVGHSAILLLVDPRGRLVGALPPGERDAIVASLQAIREFVTARL